MTTLTCELQNGGNLFQLLRAQHPIVVVLVFGVPQRRIVPKVLNQLLLLIKVQSIHSSALFTALVLRTQTRRSTRAISSRCSQRKDLRISGHTETTREREKERGQKSAHLRPISIRIWIRHHAQNSGKWGGQQKLTNNKKKNKKTEKNKRRRRRRNYSF